MKKIAKKRFSTIMNCKAIQFMERSENSWQSQFMTTSVVNSFCVCPFQTIFPIPRHDVKMIRSAKGMNIDKTKGEKA